MPEEALPGEALPEDAPTAQGPAHPEWGPVPAGAGDEPTAWDSPGVAHAPGAPGGPAWGPRGGPASGWASPAEPGQPGSGAPGRPAPGWPAPGWPERADRPGWPEPPPAWGAAGAGVPGGGAGGAGAGGTAGGAWYQGPPQKSNTTRNLLIAGVSVVVVAAVAVGLIFGLSGGSNSGYSAANMTKFVTSCEKGGAPSGYCNCGWAWLRKNVPASKLGNDLKNPAAFSSDASGLEQACKDQLHIGNSGSSGSGAGGSGSSGSGSGGSGSSGSSGSTSGGSGPSGTS